jgi:peptidoglycan/LPS O-acetylase OafA/YrhL
MDQSLPNRNHALDILRSIAIILVFLSHYSIITQQRIFGPLGQMGGMGVDLFFVLSGYLIGNQIFSKMKNRHFSLEVFYIRRLLRTLPNYFFVLALYFLLPFFKEAAITTPLWKFITFTQNFGFKPGGFSHAWSLCIEEQFYLILPLITLLIFRKRSLQLAFTAIFLVLLGEIIIRSYIWDMYFRHPGNNYAATYMSLIYGPTFSRLDGLTMGVLLALLKNFSNILWANLTKYGNFFLLAGVVGWVFVAYSFQTSLQGEYFPIAIDYSLLALSSAALVLAALSDNAFLNKIRIPGAMILATWSYAIYLTHKALIHICQLILSHWGLDNSITAMLVSATVISLVGGLLLYKYIETPFLKLRNKIGHSRKEIVYAK